MNKGQQTPTNINKDQQRKLKKHKEISTMSRNMKNDQEISTNIN